MLARSTLAIARTRAAPSLVEARRPLSALLALDEAFPDAPTLAPGAPAEFAAEVSTLPNGMKVVSSEAGALATVGVVAGVGSRDAGTLTGAPFLLKHLAFKHSTARSDLRVQRALDDMAATASTSAGRESMTYSVTCLPEFAGEAFAAVAETITSPKLAPWVIKETQASDIVAAEIDAFKADATAQTMQALHEAAFGAESPLGAAPVVAGAALTPASIGGFTSCMFSAASLAVVGTGVKHAELVAAAAAGFAAVPAAAAAPTRPASPYVGGELRVLADAPLVHVALAGAAPADTAVAGVLAQLLDGGFAQLYDGAGLVGVYGSAAPADGCLLTSGLVDQLKGAAAAGDAAVAAAKAQAKIAAAAPCVTAMGLAVLKTGACGGPAADLAAIDAVTPAAVKAAAAALLKAPTMVALGPLGATPTLASLAL